MSTLKENIVHQSEFERPVLARIGVYNIMSGGFDGYNDPSKYPPRLEALVETVKNGMKSPEVLVLIDTHRWMDAIDGPEILEKFGYSEMAIAELGDERLKKLGHDNGVAILLKPGFKIVEHSIVSLDTRNCLVVTVQNPQKNEFDVVALYLDDVSEYARIKQAKLLTEFLAKREQLRPVVIAGDFNSMESKYFHKLKKLAKFAPGPFGRKYLEVIHMTKGRAINKFRESGFEPANSPATMPTRLKWPQTIFPVPVFEFDKIIYSKDILVKNVKRAKSQASDHDGLTGVIYGYPQLP